MLFKPLHNPGKSNSISNCSANRMSSPSPAEQFNITAALHFQSSYSSQVGIRQLFQKRNNLLESKPTDSWDSHVESFYKNSNSFFNNIELMDMNLLKPDRSLFNRYGSENEFQKYYVLQGQSKYGSYGNLSFHEFELSEEKPQHFGKPLHKNNSLIQ